MDKGLFIGFMYLLLGAVCGGSFGLPSKYVRKDTPWENLWGPFFLFVTVAMPFALGPLLVKDFFAIYGHVGLAGLLLPLCFGFLWGAGSMTLGMSFAFIGLSLAYSLNYGAQIIFGAGPDGPASSRADRHGPRRRDSARRRRLRGRRGALRPGRHPQGPQPAQGQRRRSLTPAHGSNRGCSSA